MNQTIYISNLGNEYPYWPRFFEKREDLKREAEMHAHHLKFSKTDKGLKKNNETFDNLYYGDNLHVKEYRRLLKEIWEFSSDEFVVSSRETVICDKCYQILPTEYYEYKYKGTEYIFQKDLCESCMKEIFADKYIVRIN